MPPNKLHAWATSSRKGAEGVEVVKRVLAATSPGVAITDVQDAPEWRARDVDLLVGDVMAEVKTDSHRGGTLALEVVVDGKPGCVFTSRAQVWYYYLPADGKMYALDMPALGLYLARHGSRFPKSSYRTITSIRGARTWDAVVLIVPVATLVQAGVVTYEWEVSLGQDAQEATGHYPAAPATLDSPTVG